MPRNNNNNNNRSNNYLNRIQPEIPITFPNLTKNLKLLDSDSLSKNIGKDIGKYSISLINLSSLSIYKKLYNKFGNKDLNFGNQELKNIRNVYLKRLVESNPDNFPIELSLDEYKEFEISKDQKVNNIIQKLIEASKNEKVKPQIEINKQKNKNKNKKEINDNKNKKEDDKNENQENENNNYQDSKNNYNEDENSEYNNEQSYEGESYINDNEDDDSQNKNMYDDDYDEGGEY